jgi:hypothetical protein
MKLRILAALSALLIAGGVTTASAAIPVAEPLVVESVQPAPLEEDDPGWNCLIHGNQLCGVPISDVTDAWASFDGVAVAGVVGQSVGFRVDYVGTTGATSLPGYWVVPSQNYAGTSHVFTITTN